MENKYNDLSNDQLIKIIKRLEEENKDLKINLKITEILKKNYEVEKKEAVNYCGEIFDIIKNDIYMESIVGPKPTSSNKNDIKFCIKELYDLCKILDKFMKNNNIKNRTELKKIIKNNGITLDKKELLNTVKNSILDQEEDIIVEDPKKLKTHCSYKFVKGKKKGETCNKYIKNIDESNKTLCKIHEKSCSVV